VKTEHIRISHEDKQRVLQAKERHNANCEKKITFANALHLIIERSSMQSQLVTFYELELAKKQRRINTLVDSCKQLVGSVK
jgi:hypothetical protein